MACRGPQGAVLQGPDARGHEATVTGSGRPAAHHHRVHMSSPTLFDDAPTGPTARLSLRFPDPDGSDTADPEDRGRPPAVHGPAGRPGALPGGRADRDGTVAEPLAAGGRFAESWRRRHEAAARRLSAHTPA
ncbi:hypothetical protein [Nocardiopsis sp. CC223A]|uniref:hypothetical protein n=1 Tax=Nocardiopsis sp. CC223A TaxID=3044051 RepID=UPI00278BFFD7|nr:hypothetical protein [Nocardiopsis sp. CC223A]